MLWSIDSCQNRASADQYHLTVARAQVSIHRGRVFFVVIHWQITSLKWSQAQVYFFQGFISNMLCLCHYGPALLGFWFQTDFGSENSASFWKVQAGKTLSYHGHALVTLYVQLLYTFWSIFERWVHAKKLCSILKIVYFDSWSWRVLCQLVMFFNCLFLMQDVQNETDSCYQESSVIHGLFVYWVFGWETRRLSKLVIRFRMASFWFFTLLNA